MSGAPRIRSINVADSEEVRPVLGPAGNKARSIVKSKPKPAVKPLRKAEKMQDDLEEKKAKSPSIPASPRLMHYINVPSVLRRQHSNLSLDDASCSSDASTDSFHSRASTGRLTRSSSTASRRKQSFSKPEKLGSDTGSTSPTDNLHVKKRCAWVTPNTDLCYASFHDEEWGVPVHDDRKLFELLILSGALAELTWPVILNKRHLFREVFADFDPVAVSKLNEKKITAPGSSASSLLSEIKLRGIIENARQICKIMDEFGSFDKYIWSFVNHKPIISRFRYPRQVPVKTPKADVLSKDLVRRGFRSVGPTVIYSFMQVVGITNDHLINCFRFQECLSAEAGDDKEDDKAKAKEKKTEDTLDLGLARTMNELSIASE